MKNTWFCLCIYISFQIWPEKKTNQSSNLLICTRVLQKSKSSSTKSKNSIERCIGWNNCLLCKICSIQKNLWQWHNSLDSNHRSMGRGKLLHPFNISFQSRSSYSPNQFSIQTKGSLLHPQTRFTQLKNKRQIINLYRFSLVEID